MKPECRKLLGEMFKLESRSDAKKGKTLYSVIKQPFDSI